MKFLVEIQPIVSEEYLRVALEDSFARDAIKRKFSVTALAEDHVIVSADALLRLQKKAAHNDGLSANLANARLHSGDRPL